MQLRLILGLFVGMLLLCMPASLRAESPPHLGYGMMLAYPPGNLGIVRDAGFDWYKYFVYWRDIEPDQDGAYNWATVDWRLDEACEHNLHVLLRVERDPQDWTPIQDDELTGWEVFFQALSTHIAERRAACPFPYRVALEIWNEPNLDFQWGYQPVDPVRYTKMVRHAYRGAKSADPHILIVAGSLAPTGGTGDDRAMDDVAFLKAMYGAGLKGHFDAISIHNYGFGGPPEDKAYGSGILNFRRAEDIHDVMVAHGDGDLPVWATEFGWLLASSDCADYWEEIGFAWQQVTAEQQADYLARAFAYADTNWPWMQTMIVSNLDFSILPWYQPCEPLRWFSILEPDGQPRPGYTALAEMDKNPRSWSVWGMEISPAALGWMQALTERCVDSQAVTVRNTGELSFTWTAKADSYELPLELEPAYGEADETFAVTIDSRGLPTGTYTSSITIQADHNGVLEDPVYVPVHVRIVDTVYRTYLPTAQRR